MNIVRPSTEEWIDRLGMTRFGSGLGNWRGWKPGSRDLLWDRVITSVTEDCIVVDAPITTAIEAKFGGGSLQPYSWPGRISHVGVENLRCESAFIPGNPKDEAHSWMALTMENIENAWVRQVTFAHFAGSAVALWESCKWITVQDCASLSPVSENAGYRRHTFFTMGQLTLFLHCWAEQGRHDFSVGHCAAGPNAFVKCRASLPSRDSGPIESWASGTLYDNVNIEGNALRLCNRRSKGQGIGWAAANSVLWQCSAAVVDCENPPTARNWAFGCWGEFTGDGIWRHSNSFVKPASLYLSQLTDTMVSGGQSSLDYNYGLWYDRRRDDHERIRRMDADVLPPFYEPPFARSGRGTAWDGLSKYDLTKYNTWYWSRLKTFADLCDRKGLVLLHQNYFQHNILEAGAHWADFPWRSANNINKTGFPEPPSYAGSKRVFMDGRNNEAGRKNDKNTQNSSFAWRVGPVRPES